MEYVIAILLKHYGHDTESGCYVNGKWLSLGEIIRIIRENY